MRQLFQPIAAFVYYNRQAPPAGATRPPAAGERTERAPELRPSSENYFISLRDGTTREIK